MVTLSGLLTVTSTNAKLKLRPFTGEMDQAISSTTWCYDLGMALAEHRTLGALSSPGGNALRLSAPSWCLMPA